MALPDVFIIPQAEHSHVSAVVMQLEDLADDEDLDDDEEEEEDEDIEMEGLDLTQKRSKTETKLQTVLGVLDDKLTQWCRDKRSARSLPQDSSGGQQSNSLLREIQDACQFHNSLYQAQATGRIQRFQNMKLRDTTLPKDMDDEYISDDDVVAVVSMSGSDWQMSSHNPLRTRSNADERPVLHAVLAHVEDVRVTEPRISGRDSWEHVPRASWASPDMTLVPHWYVPVVRNNQQVRHKGRLAFELPMESVDCYDHIINKSNYLCR